MTYLNWLRLPKTLLLASLIVAALFVVACGGAASEPETPAAETKMEATEAPAMEAQPTATRDIMPTSAPLVDTKPTAAPEATEAPAMATDGVIMGGFPPAHSYSAPDHWGTHASGTLNQIMHSSPVYNQLVEFDPETDDRDDLINDLAESWEVTDGGLAYVFKIREGVKWHDGESVSSEDVAYSVDRWVEADQPRPRTGEVSAYYEHGSVEIVDPLTVKIPLKFPAADFFTYLGADVFKIVPKHVGEVKDLQQWENMVGSGPFTVEEYKKDVSTTYVKNPDYFKEGRPYLDGFKTFIIKDKGTIIAAFKTQQVVFATSSAIHLSVDEREKMIEDMKGELVAHGQPYGCLQVAMFNVNVSPFDDPKVRTALNLAVHRRPILETIQSGRGDVGIPLQPGSWYSLTPEEAEQVPGFRELNGEKHPDDIAEAKRLLTEAGYPDGFEATYSYRTYGQYGDIAAIVKDQLAEFLNVRFTLETFEPATGLMKWRDNAFAIANQGHCYTANVPDSLITAHYRPGGTRNYTGFDNPQVEALYQKQAAEADPEKRKELLLEVQDLLLSPEVGTPSIGLFWFWGDPLVAHKSMKNLHGAPTVQAQLKYEHIWWDQSESEAESIR